ncbi:GtrA family protein [Micrococcus cohnii]|mgnify:CR=1 FL=1|uniref:Putative flippase GtrA n=1 Tax=Micrococcus cohnii TaxID=993416 RepID=A0A7W7GM31_9MICC|nr:GtrA family protein [Micrococcus cohnii]MBB4734620.1 putative flippase GtrA [Micrococcus cohnii]
MLSKLWTRLRELVRTLWREVAKFGVVGAAAFVVDSGVWWWLMHGPMEGSNVKSKIVAGIVATLFSWLANRLWTFRQHRNGNKVRELVMFLIMNAIGLGIQAFCVFVCQYWMGLDDQRSVFIAGNVIGLFFGTVFRYFAYRFWVFQSHLDGAPDHAEAPALITGEMPYVPNERHRLAPEDASTPQAPRGADAGHERAG